MTYIENKITANKYNYLDDFFSVSESLFSDNIAIDDGENEISYASLDKEANRLANVLRAKGCQPNERICFMSSKKIVAYKSILAILKSGACFVPLNSEDPAERILFLLKSIRPKVLVVESVFFSKMHKLCRENELDIAIIDADGAEVNSSLNTSPVIVDRTPEDLAYIIFTSGSTGVPKGVMVYHRNIVHFLNNCFSFFNICEPLRFAHCSEYTFDPSIFDIFFCWATGGTVVPMNKRSYRINPFAFFEGNNINVVFTVPSLINSLKTSEVLASEDLSSIRHLIYTGEALSADLVTEWASYNPHCQQYNFYGTTETAIISHWHKIKLPITSNSIVPIGFPVSGVSVKLIEEGGEVQDGEIGESVVAGTQISPGYWDNEAENKLRFKCIGEDKLLGHKSYFTGDLLVKDKQGCFHYHGRKDRQVKVRGHRIELLEVEKVITSIPCILEAAVHVVENEFQIEQLIGVIYAEQITEDDDLQVDNYLLLLKEKLPSYMCPAKVICCKKPLPRNKNGKIDYHKIVEIINGETNE